MGLLYMIELEKRLRRAFEWQHGMLHVVVLLQLGLMMAGHLAWAGLDPVSFAGLRENLLRLHRLVEVSLLLTTVQIWRSRNMFYDKLQNLLSEGISGIKNLPPQPQLLLNRLSNLCAEIPQGPPNQDSPEGSPRYQPRGYGALDRDNYGV